MKYLKQFLIILAVSLMGEICKALLPLPIPASIYGMVFMFVFLLTGLIKLDQVRDAGKFLIEIMPVMFIPAGVGLMSSWGVLKSVLIPVSVITVITIFTVMAATGLVSQVIIRRSRKNISKSKEAA
nr:CidA/LrgA family protein [uncultured Butyrivibrio sp.]